ncbi:TPR domain-containing protein [Actinobacillus seminis]|uniref:TPR domain-containing protein n=1 Tax=Actinobacillus seminis TaxID=722 RepID=UPI003B93F952
MNLLLAGVVIFIVLILLLLWLPMASSIKPQHNYRQQQNIALYQQQMAQQPSRELATELSQRLLQDEKYLENQPHFSFAQDKSAVSFGTKVALASVLIGIPLIWYVALPRYSDALLGKQAYWEQKQKAVMANLSGDNQEYIEKIQQQLRQDPNDAKLWLLLGRAYMQANEWDSALISFSNAEKLEGSKANILGLAASALYYQAGERITPKVSQLIDVILQQDPQEISALSLLAAEAYKQQDYARALSLWQNILDSGNSQADRRMIIQRMKSIEMLQSSTSP